MTNLIPFLLLVLSLPFLLAAPLPPPLDAAPVSLHIDCGSSVNSTDAYGNSWLADRDFTSGYGSMVSEPLIFTSLQEKTLRFFPISSGKKNCYIIPSLPYGRYLFRTFTVYDNYDGKLHPPSFDVSVEGTLVFSWRSPWDEITAKNVLRPILQSLEIVQVDKSSYDAGMLGDSQIMVNYGRFSCGTKQWGHGFSNDSDRFSRTWQSDVGFRHSSSGKLKALSALNSVKNADQPPNYFPMKLYREAVTLADDGVLEYRLEVDAKLDYLLWFHFAEIDTTVRRASLCTLKLNL